MYVSANVEPLHVIQKMALAARRAPKVEQKEPANESLKRGAYIIRDPLGVRRC